MAFKTMPKELIIKLLESHEDTITGPMTEVFAKIKSKTCPNCNIPLVPKPDLSTPFVGESHIPRFQAYCTECNASFDMDDPSS